VAACDLNPETIEETVALAQAEAAPGVRVTGHTCDVADEAQVLRFRDEVVTGHATDHVDLVFSNAGAGGGKSFVEGDRDVWERTFAIDFWGVYYCARAFLPLLIASGDGVLVNTSSVNGLWASLGPGMPNHAYSTAKFAVRGFTEGLIEDLRSHAPQVRVALVMPGHVGTNIIRNSFIAQGRPAPEKMSDAEAEELIPAEVREALIGAGALPERPTGADLRQFLIKQSDDFRDKAETSAAEAAVGILDGVRAGAWRILIGKGATMIDERVRAKPEAAYDYAELFAGLVPDSGD
jgi:NAD(P)-dependent dehydrogenase (short-subunit alcohol dehydrogenase family)